MVKCFVYMKHVGSLIFLSYVVFYYVFVGTKLQGLWRNFGAHFCVYWTLTLVISLISYL